MDGPESTFALRLTAIEGGMRMLTIVIALLPGTVLLPGMATAAERTPGVSPAVEPQKKLAPAGFNPCAQYGAGYVQVKGSTTCVKAGGYLRIEVGR
jgi:hypothetical protein